MTVLRITKIGGSLLDLPGLPHIVQTWLSAQTLRHNVFVVGGGRRVEKLRQLTRCDPERLHWHAIAIMDRNGRRLAQEWRHVQTCDGWEALASIPRTVQPDCHVLIGLRRMLKLADRPNDLPMLPKSWSVTSDSIAAWIAKATKADELVLLKSCPPTGRHLTVAPGGGFLIPSSRLRNLAESGIVDEYFPQAADGVPVRIVDLRRIEQ